MLDLSSNRFEGPIPDPLSALAASRRSLQSDNILRRSVPALRVLNLGQNNIDGFIPPSIGMLTNLISIELNGNSLNGTIPEAIGLLPKLVLFDVSNNTLNGTLPTFLSESMSFIDVGSNEISGNLDETFCAGLSPNLTEIVIDCENIKCSCCDSCTNKSKSVFVHEKQEVDRVCGRAAFRQDEGERCEEICSPHFFECCNPFEAKISFNDNLSTQNETDFAPQTFLPSDPSATINSSQCSFGKEVTGCLAYAKCQALTRRIDSAPANLEEICSFDRLRRDPESCKALCARTKCCYSDGPDHCLTDQFDICMDYSPCQNLRVLDDRFPAEAILEIAPRILDNECFLQQPLCDDLCAMASCCSSTNTDSCLQFNFLSCLTYFPCSSIDFNFTIPAQFNQVPKPPLGSNVSCSTSHNNTESDFTCGEKCEVASCCFAHGEENCFTKDPLGCLAWSSECLMDSQNSTLVIGGLSNTTAPIETSAFGSNSSDINAACGRESIKQDGGVLCNDLCNPYFREHCSPFGTLNGTVGDSFVDFIPKCVDYSKCQVALSTSTFSPAPESLGVLCSMERLQKDSGPCTSLCRAVDCCFSSSGDSCLVEAFNVCLDYAPCQNLRFLEESRGLNFTNSTRFLPVAPQTLSIDCLKGDGECLQCEQANCCSTPGVDSCLRSNFMSCLTYASCPSDSGPSIALPSRFSFVPQIPQDIRNVCDSRNETELAVTTGYSCEQYCDIVACCFKEEDSCFEKDPLGCLEWFSHCQVLL